MAFIDISDQLDERTSVFEQLAGFTLDGTDPVDIEQIWVDIDRAADLTGSADADTEAWLDGPNAWDAHEIRTVDPLDEAAERLLIEHDLATLRQLDRETIGGILEGVR